METPRILRLGALMHVTQLSRASIYRQIRAGTMPRPLRLGPRAVGWRKEEIDEWLATRERAGSSPQRRPGSETRGSRIHTSQQVDP